MAFHYCTQDTENSFYPQKCPHATLKTILPSTTPNLFFVTMNYFVLSRILHKWKHQHVPFCLSTLIQHNAFEIHPCGCLTMLLWGSTSLYKYTMFIQAPIGWETGLFLVLRLKLAKLLWSF